MTNYDYISIGNLKVEIEKTLKNPNHFIVTDSRVLSLYPSYFEGVRFFVLPNGETSKSIGQAMGLVAAMQQANIDRADKLVAFGGGVVGDVVGFVASVYMRGIDWINIPTTLLAQVDSSIGGKTGLNFNGKNIVGSFYLPKQVLIDNSFLITLDDKQWLSGVGEIVKTALLNKDLYEYTTSNLSDLLTRDMTVVAKIVEQCVEIKYNITQFDLKDKALRQTLNIGHTIGHVLEYMGEYGLTHGEYVLQGIFVETSIFADMINQEYLASIRDCIKKLINCNFTILPIIVAEYALKDKKNTDGKIHFVVPIDKNQTKFESLTQQELTTRLKRISKNKNKKIT